MNFFEKLASDLEKTAAFVENIEKGEYVVKKLAEEAKIKEAEEKRKTVLAPIKEKLATAVVDENDIEERLKTASIDALELISKSLESDGGNKTASKNIPVDNSWGSVEENKSGKGKFAGYKDPIEAFAMGD